MNFAFSEEQEELRRTVRQFLESKSPESEVRRLMETTEGYDPAVWKQMGQELGLQSLTIPEAFGGQGFTFIELGIVLEEMGRVLLCAPYYSSVVLAANDPDPRRHRRAEGSTAARHRERRHDRDAGVHRAERQVGRTGVTLEATESGGKHTLSGEKMFVLDGHVADTDRRRRPHRSTASASSPSTVTPTASPVRRCRRWT